MSFPNQLAPDVLEAYLSNLLTESNQVTERDLSDLQGRLTGVLTEQQVARLHGSVIAEELGARVSRITAGRSPLLVLDEIIGRRLAMQLDAMGYRGRQLVIYEAGGGRHEVSISGALSLLPLCRQLDMPSTITLTGIEIAPGNMTTLLSTYPIVELHCFSVGSGAPAIEAISPTINTGRFVQVQALSVTKASEISRIGGSVVASGHGGLRSRQYDGVTVDVGMPGRWRRGCSCSEEEARVWARQHGSSLESNDDTDSGGSFNDGRLGPQAVVFLCRVLDVGVGRRFPVL